MHCHSSSYTRHPHIWGLISWFLCTLTLVLLTPDYYKTTSSSPFFSHFCTTFDWCRTRNNWTESVKMAVLIRPRIRAVVFNQRGQWQRLWRSRGDCDDDSRWRGSTENTHAHFFFLSVAWPTLPCLCWEQHSGKRGDGQKGEVFWAAESHEVIWMF